MTGHTFNFSAQESETCDFQSLKTVYRVNIALNISIIYNTEGPQKNKIKQQQKNRKQNKTLIGQMNWKGGKNIVLGIWFSLRNKDMFWKYI